MIEIPAAVLAIARVPREARLPVDRHQRPDPVHAGRRPRRRGRVAPLRSAASGGAEADRAWRSRAANKAKVPIAVCGEMAGEVQLTRLLLGLGLRNFSMHPAHLLTVKQRVLTSDVARGQAARRPHAPRRRPGEARRAARQAQRAVDAPRRAGIAGACARCSPSRVPCMQACRLVGSERRSTMSTVPCADACFARAAAARRAAARGARPRPRRRRRRRPAFALPDRAAARPSRSTSCAGRSCTSISGRRGAGRAAARFRG